MASTTKQTKSKANDMLTEFLSFTVAPRKHFHRLVIAGLFLVALSIAFHIYFFYRIESYSFLGGAPAQDTPAPTVNKVKLKSVLDRYAQKETARMTAATLESPVADPAK